VNHTGIGGCHRFKERQLTFCHHRCTSAYLNVQLEYMLPFFNQFGTQNKEERIKQAVTFELRLLIKRIPKFIVFIVKSSDPQHLI
jgi:hypothetical protein